MFFSFAKEKGFDPLVAENWYSVTSSLLLEQEGAPSVLFYYDGSFVKALMHLFPDMDFDETKFFKTSRYFWLEKNNRREFFHKISREGNFDPLVADNWYLVPPDVIMNSKGATSVLAQYDGSLVNALSDLFPGVELDPSKFRTQKLQDYWTYASNRRAFFDKFAKDSQFDPLVAKNWYSIPPETIPRAKGGSSVLAYHMGSVARALLHLYPDIGLERKMLHQKRGPKPAKE